MINLNCKLYDLIIFGFDGGLYMWKGEIKKNFFYF